MATHTAVDLPELKAGIYRHYKGPLYLVLGYAHDANGEDLTTGDEAYAWRKRNIAVAPAITPLVMLGDRVLVVYIGLDLDDDHAGSPRLAVRTHADFFAQVCMRPEHSHYGKETKDGDICHAAPRFQYVSAQWTGDRA